jgi:hypothetical protein
MGLGSGIRDQGSGIRDQGSIKKPILDPGYRGQKAPDPRSGTLNTGILLSSKQLLYLSGRIGNAGKIIFFLNIRTRLSYQKGERAPFPVLADAVVQIAAQPQVLCHHVLPTDKPLFIHA